MENVLYLSVSVGLSAVRNITSKKTALDTEDNSQFFLSQTVLFLAATVLLFAFDINCLAAVSPLTLLYGVIYGVLLVLSQWMYTLSLKQGSTSVCTVVYSLGFVFPTVSGALFFNEAFTILNLIGLVLALVIIFLSAKKEGGAKKGTKLYITSMLTAMLASGGLGIMQKVQQTSAVAAQTNAFLTVAFAFAFICSLTAMFICKKGIKLSKRIVIYPAVTGLCFGGINLFNTILVGRMTSAVFFPVRNIATILISALMGMILFKEKLTLRTGLIIGLSVIAVLIFSI